MDKNPENQAKPVLGANDGASGVAVLLHIAEIIAKQRPTAGVDIILFDGEDYGKEGDDQMYCLGSKYFAASVESDYQPLFGILLDMVGDKEAEFLQEEYSLQFASDIVRLVWSSARSLAIPNFKVKGHPPILDDHVPLTRIAGIKTVNIIDAELIGHKSAKPGRKYWHTTQDTPDQCSEKILGRVGKLLLYITFGAQPV